MILESLYLILPGVFANMAPVLFKRVNFLNYPVDFNKRLRGKPIFGKNKTYRGFFFGIAFAIVIAYLQRYLYTTQYLREISLINYGEVNPITLGSLMGFGVLFGDLVKSFFKRRLNISAGARWFPFDQLDALIGGLLFMSIIYIPPIAVTVFLLFTVPFIHVIINHIGFYLGLKETRW